MKDFVSTKMRRKTRYHTSRGQNSYSPSFSFSDLQLTNDKSEKSGRPAGGPFHFSSFLKVQFFTVELRIHHIRKNICGQNAFL